VIILAHRGYWKSKSEQNTATAFKRSFSHGFGVETDVRDYKGELVISHDIADSSSMSLDEFFSTYNKYGANLPLALNIKSDGLQAKLKDLIKIYSIRNYFVFDMSIPDALTYLDFGMNTLIRRSEYEHELEILGNIHGIWLDQFQANWYDRNLIENIIKKWKLVCIVSPDLHGRDNKTCWSLLANSSASSASKMMICTDHPLQAEEYFNEK
jgi:glycerophosphoryl diester phosphodiesterase